MDTKKLRSIVALPVLLFLLFVSFILLANSLIQKPSVQKRFLEGVSGLTGYAISAGKIEIYLWKGMGIRVYDFKAYPKEGIGEIGASEAIVFVDVLQLLKGRIVPKRLHVERPVIDLVSSEEQAPGEDRIGESLFSLLVLPDLDSLTMEKGYLFIRPFPIRFVNLSLEIKKTGAKPLSIKCQGEARLRRESTPFHLQGEITQGQKVEKSPSVDLTLSTGKMPLRWIPFPEEIPVTQGTCESRLRIEAKNNKATKVSGKVFVESARFSVRKKDRTKDYSIKEMTLELRSFMERGKIHVPYLKLRMPGASFSLNLRLDLQEKENPYLRLEAQSLLMSYSTVAALFPTPLVASWVERDLFPLLRSGDVLLESFLLDGKVRQLKKLELPENQGSLAMGFDCKNFTVHGDRLREPLKDVSAKVTLKDGALLVSELKGVSGKSQIREGLLKFGDLFQPHSVFESRVQGSFDLEDVMRQCTVDFIPAWFKEGIEKTESLSGTIDGQVRFKYQASMESPEITKADLMFRDCALKQKHWPISLVLKEGRLQIGEDNHFKGSWSWGASSFEAEGAFLMKGLSLEPQWIDLVAELDSSQAWSLMRPDWSPAQFKGPALCRGSLKKDGHLWSIKGSAEIGALTVDHELFLVDPPGPGDKIIFDFDLIPEKQIHFRQILWELGKSSLNLSGNYPLSPESDAALQCSIPALSLEDLGIHLKPEGFVARGVLKGALQAMILKKDLSTALVSGEIIGEKLSFTLTSLPSPIRECDVRALFSGQNIVIPSFTMMTGESSLNGKAELRGWDGLKGDLTVTSSPLNLSDFIPAGKQGRGKKKPSSFAENTRIQVSLDAQPARWKKIDSEKLKADLHFRKGALRITRSEIQVDRGVLEVIGDVKDETMAFSGHVEFKDQPLEALLKRLGIEEVYEGSLTMEAQLNTQGKDFRDMVSHLEGDANVLVNQGVIRKSNAFLMILEFLSLQNIFTKRPPDLSKEGLYFESFGGFGKVEQGVVRTENMQMKSPVLNAVGAGKLDLGQGLLDFDLGVQPLGTIDTVMSNIPILGHILTGDNRSLITYYFKVKGPLLNPQVEHVPFKNLGSGIAGVLKRLFLSPVKLFEDISEGLKSLPAPDKGQETPGNQPGH